MSLITDLADAIERQEGYAPGTRAYRNNNPGNIWDGLGNGKVRRIWPQYPIDDAGFLMLPSYSTGRALMESQISIKIGRGETLTQLLNEWDSGDPASTRATYVSNVAGWTGLPVDVPLNALGDSPNPYLVAEGVVPPAAGETDNDGATLTEAGAFDPSPTTWVWIGLGGLAVYLISRALDR
jgi:hypothetical protein